MNKFLSFCVVVLFATSVHSQIILNEAFIKNNFVEVGVNTFGAYGTQTPAPVSYHPRPNSTGTARNLGFVADPDQDGWDVGTPNYFGDFFYPGQQQEGFSIQMNGSVFHNWTSNSLPQILGDNISITTTTGITEAVWQGTKNGLLVKQKTIIPQSDVFFIIRVELTNTTTTTMNNVYYMRTLDPDNDVTLSNIYQTLNEIVYTLPNSVNSTLVSAKGLIYTNCYLGLGTKDCRAKPFIVTSELNPMPSHLISGIHNQSNGSYYTYTGSITGDVGIGLTFSVGDIEPGQTKRIALAYVLKESDLDVALAQTLPEINLEGTPIVTGAAYNICESNVVNLEVSNGEDYVWQWEPEELFSSPTGDNVSLTIPNVTTTITVTGQSDCNPISYSFTVVPSTYEASIEPENHIICSGTSTSYNPLQGVTSSTSTIEWYDSAVGGILLSSSPNFVTPVLTNTTTEPLDYIYYYQEITSVGCTSERIPFTVTVYETLDLSNKELKSCASGGNTSVFNLLDYQNILQPINNGVITYYASFADYTANNPIINPSNYTNISNNQVVIVSVEINSTCSETVELTLSVFDLLMVNTAELIGCESDFNDKYIFDLTNGNGQITSDPLTTFEYYNSLANAQAGTFPITDFTAYENISNPQIIHVAVSNGNCRTFTTLKLEVFDNPVINPATLTSCEEFVDGTAEFNLNDAISSFGSATTNNYIFYASFDDLSADNPIANPATFRNTSSPQIIHVKATNSNGCFVTTTLTLQVLPITRFSISDFITCDDDYDGKKLFNLGLKSSEISASLPADTYTYTYFLTEENAFFDTNAIVQDYENTISPETIYVRVQGSLGCPYIVNFDLVVRDKPQLFVEETRRICDGKTIILDAGSGFDTYLWSNGAVTPSITISEAGTYTVTVSYDYGTLSCTDTKTIVVTESNVATINNVVINDWTINNNSITVFANGLGDYEYSINNIDYQDSSVFAELETGVYTIYVRDKFGCGTVNKDFYLLTYPNFFTPNGDGINDLWQIYYSKSEPNLKVSIFDRYGRLVKTLVGESDGWDGTFCNEKMPSTDYWFVVERVDGKIYKGHFTLIR